jgi:DNA-directed RNA polymerase specialized sigma subunit
VRTRRLTKSRPQRAIERRFGRPWQEVLRSLRAEELTQIEIAERLGVAQTTVSLWERSLEREEPVAV